MNRRKSLKYSLISFVALFFIVISFVSCEFMPGATPSPGKISGTVVLEDGASLAGISIIATADGETSYKALPDSSGNFEITDVPAGTYKLTVSKESYNSVSKTDIIVSAGSATSVGKITLTFKFGYVKGKITDDEGNPLAGATVTVIGTNIRKYSGTTDASGNYSIKTKVGQYKEIDAKGGCFSGKLAINKTVSENGNISINDFQLVKTHNFELVQMKESTKTETGFRKYTCSSCGLEKTEDIPCIGSAKWAGVRASTYGMADSFGRYPDVDTMVEFGAKMESCYPGSTGAYILIVGTIGGVSEETLNNQNGGYCMVDFPLSKDIPNVVGSDVDMYEDYLTAMDNAGYSVWLQVESAEADLVELAKEVMNHYKHHPSVKGFGIDVEWYKWRTRETEGKNGQIRLRNSGDVLETAEARRVLTAIQAINSEYTVFVKHWDERYLPEAAPGFIYVNDSQGFSSLSRIADEFADWAESYPDNPVMFQIGYERDDGIWGNMENPAKELGEAIIEECDDRGLTNPIGIIWVDFTLKTVMDKID